jgi:hypothetical protein
VAGAAVTSDRCALGLRVMDAGKDYFTDKAPLTTLEQLAAAKAAVERTGKKYAVYYSERLHVESAVFASQLIAEGAIGRVVQVIGTGPHRLSAASRPAWFSTAASCVTSDAIRRNSFWRMPTLKTPRYCTARSATLTIPMYPSWRTSAMPTCWPTTVRPIISVWIGLRRKRPPHGVTVG